MTRTSNQYPPSTGYQRPAERRFYVWQDRFITYGRNTPGWGKHPWRWCCTMCDPPTFGFRARRGAWQSIMTDSLPRHMRNRHYHHQWAARKSQGR